MPSPIGHALGGIALAWVVVPRRNVHSAVVLAAVALAPDLDLLVGDHRGISHSVGAAVAAGATACGVLAVRKRCQSGVRAGSDPGQSRVRAGSDPGQSRVREGSDPFLRDAVRWGAAVALAWGSHIFLDWLSNDTRPPLGVMALWPITTDYYKAAIEIFPPVSRRWGDTRFWSHNVWAAFVELALLGPIAWVTITTFRGRRTRT